MREVSIAYSKKTIVASQSDYKEPSLADIVEIFKASNDTREMVDDAGELFLVSPHSYHLIYARYMKYQICVCRCSTTTLVKSLL